LFKERVMNSNNLKPLFVFELANNHMGDLKHGLNVVREVAEVCKSFDFDFGFKLQYRDLDTFIHPEFQNRTDIKYIKRFLETRLNEKQFKLLKDEIVDLGFLSICTPFDEKSVDLIDQQKFNIIKIASCSFTDWPLLERVVRSDKPIIASTAGASLEEIDKVVSFFEHRQKNLSIMHCVAEYPTAPENLQLNQIDLLKARYPQVRVGYSTHEYPNNFDAIKIAIAKGATVFEKHVGVKTQAISLNDYSANPEQIYQWLKSAQAGFEMCGISGERSEFTEKEKSSLISLRRGVFAKQMIEQGQKITLSDIFLAMPTIEEQITANDLSKYTEFYAQVNIDTSKPILSSIIKRVDNREKVYQIMKQVKAILQDSKVFVPSQLDFEISHHYGLEHFEEYGATIINFVNRAYCKKLIVVLPGQEHPEQHHKLKEETFTILYGDVSINLDGIQREYKPGEIVVVEKNVKHSFRSQNGAVIEEISSTHYPEDSYYTDTEIANNKNRKTLLTYWLE